MGWPEDARSKGGQVTAIIQRKKAIETYYVNPNKCKFCGKVIHIGDRKVSTTRRRQFCDKSCAGKFNTSPIVRPRTENGRNCVVCGAPLIGQQRIICSRKCRTRNDARRPNYVRDRGRRRRERVREKSIKVFGDKCAICGSKNHLVLHRKDGKKHKTSQTSELAFRDSQNWVRLCFRCHYGVHWVMNKFRWGWGEIEESLP